jgi:hypothetical protein
MTRRALLSSAILLAQPSLLDRLNGRWRSRITTFQGGRARSTPLRFTFAAAAAVVIEEYRAGGELAWVYRGTAEVSSASELSIRISAVTDPSGKPSGDSRTRYEVGETYNLGAIEPQSATRVRIGSMELQKELE